MQLTSMIFELEFTAALPVWSRLTSFFASPCALCQ
jgi:hypothetical protein